MRKLKRLLASVLTAAMLATFLPVGVLAAGQDETVDLPGETVINEEQEQLQDEQGQPEQDQPEQGQPEQDQLEQDQPEQDQPEQNPDENSDEPLNETLDDGQDHSEQAPPISLDGLELYVTVNDEKIYLEPENTPFSLIPLEYYRYNLDLSAYFPAELKAFNVSDMVDMLTERYASQRDPFQNGGQIVAWAKWGFYDENGNYVSADGHDDDYTLLGEDTTIDLSYNLQHNGSYDIELIVGAADQLNPNNIRCHIDAQVGYHYNLLEAEAYTTESPRKQIKIYDESLSPNTSINRNILRISVDPDTWTDGREAHLGLRLSSYYSGLTAKVYEGSYQTEEAIANANAKEITSQIMNQDNLENEGGYQDDYSWKKGYTGMPEVTFVLTRNDRTACVMPVILYMYPDKLYVSLDQLSTRYPSGSSFNYYSAASWRSVTKTGFDGYRIYTLYSSYKADETYYVNLYATDPKTNKYDADAVKSAYEGYYDTATDAAEQTDIKKQLFDSYYAVDFAQHSDGIQFTVIDINDKVWHFGMEVKESPEDTNLPPEPSPLSRDTYFRMETALVEKGGSQYNAYVMQYSDDSYYYRGYQTVFLLKQDNTPVPAGQITPKFFSGSKVNVYAGHDVDGNTVSAAKQISQETPVDFTPGKPVQYSAAAENGSHLKNYFVTFLTQQSSPALFVNGTNDETNYQEDPQDPAKKIPARVVNLTSDYNYRHDIFFANLGAAELTGLNVTLTGLDGTGEAENVKLDDYWTIGATDSLAGFTSTYSQFINGTYDSNGELPSVGKIRLVPQVDEAGNMKAGQINGLLTISADGVEPVKILLTGSAGSFQINTTKLLDGVKYVSYSSLIQTNYISDGSSGTDMVRFTASGLPQGITIKPNGELYGIPTTPGTYNVTITATATVDGEQKSDTKTYTMTITDNEDMNVWNYDQSIWNGNLDYTPKIAIPNENMDGTNINTEVASYGSNNWNQPEQVLETQPEGDYQYFIDRVFVNNVQLTPGVDYTSEEGSIKLTIRTQSLRKFGNGTHTITAEARIGDKKDGALRRVAQNYTLTTLGTSNRPSGGGSSSGSSSSRDDTPVSYAINVADVNHGYASASARSAKSGTKVTVTLTPDDGYAANGLVVTRANGRTVSATKVSDTKYTFIMPSSKVTVTPDFVLIPVIGLFTDVAKGSWFFDAVQYVFDRGLMVGTSESTFQPDGIVSRSMIVTVLYNLEGKPEVSAVSPFSDVQLGQWFANPVIWAAENNLVSGYGDGTYGVNENLTREQAAVILYNYAKLKGYNISQNNDLSQFADASSVSSYALPALQWANEAGLINGYDNNTLAPTNNATRAQFAVIFKAFCENVVK